MWYSAHLFATLVPSAFQRTRAKPCHDRSSTVGVGGLCSGIHPIVSILLDGSDRHRQPRDCRREAKVGISISSHHRSKHGNRGRKSRCSAGDNGVILVKNGKTDLALDLRSTPALEVFRAIGAIP
jgi:hypothetical protein